MIGATLSLVLLVRAIYAARNAQGPESVVALSAVVLLSLTAGSCIAHAALLV